ncbi:aminoglycoside phosphotransferase family protein [Streptomyces sp. SID3343]|uniref:aminoglycoside phosphotransferase family protein n=1 Tax=Streptomyces sp. SID3343 TaxID=2690260 RepID=UPI001370F84E|nr:aminoglycoside phosphotransferase family protein [Streptomyces sp. SID3343]MYV97581.1 phosphotransferase [Streptomyces sp. SID3343]
MKDHPKNLDEADLFDALTAWGIDPVSLSYAPVGFGDFHWIAADAEERRWFVTVSDLTTKDHGDRPNQGEHGADAGCRNLTRAMDTAACLYEHNGLDFVVPPLRTLPGAGNETIRRLGAGYAVGVFPFVDGTAGHFDHVLTPHRRGLVLDLLAKLHRTAPPASTPPLRTELAARGRLEAILGEPARAWHGGPYAEPAAALMSDHAEAFRRRLHEFDRRVEESNRRPAEAVVTHGEPHPGNVVWLDERPVLVDWDTVGMGLPERDLWLVIEDTADLARYVDSGGRPPDPARLALHRLRWDLDDVAAYLDLFRSPHARTPDTDSAWAGLAATVERLADGGGP